MTSLDPTTTNPIPTPTIPPAEPQSAFITALYSINPLQDFAALPSIPCARYSLLFGIVAGASVGSLRFIFARSSALKGASRWSQVGAATNWAVGAWGVGTLGAWLVFTFLIYFLFKLFLALHQMKSNKPVSIHQS